MAKKASVKSKGFFSNWIVRNLLAAVTVMLILLVGAMIALNVLTKHNKVIIVPDFTNMSVSEAAEAAASAGMRTDVVDSVFVKRMAKGAVYRQNPKPGSKVKEGRRISLTINAVNAKKLTMPNLVGYSMRQAMAELQSRGLVLGKLIYVQDMATNNVLRQLYRNMEIEPGTMIESESVIDIVVGLDASDNSTFVPDVTGMKHLAAVDVIHGNSLNIKNLRFDSTVVDYDDSLSAVVYRQEPEPSDSISILKGNEMVLYMTLDLEKVPQKVVEEQFDQQ